jgi:hypothetical protein
MQVFESILNQYMPQLNYEVYLKHLVEVIYFSEFNRKLKSKFNWINFKKSYYSSSKLRLRITLLFMIKHVLSILISKAKYCLSSHELTQKH